MAHRQVALISLLFLLAGCGEKPTTDRKTSPSATNLPPEKSTAQTLIGGFTGQTAIEKGKETRAKLDAIGKKAKADMDEVMQ
jgi:hypothetical protein